MTYPVGTCGRSPSRSTAGLPLPARARVFQQPEKINITFMRMSFKEYRDLGIGLFCVLGGEDYAECKRNFKTRR